MDIPLNAAVACTDGKVGKLDALVVDSDSGAITNLISSDPLTEVI